MKGPPDTMSKKCRIARGTLARVLIGRGHGELEATNISGCLPLGMKRRRAINDYNSPWEKLSHARLRYNHLRPSLIPWPAPLL